jgi:histidine triad (HIT) family protein
MVIDRCWYSAFQQAPRRLWTSKLSAAHGIEERRDMTLDAACIFCRIIRGEVPSLRVFENDRTLAFMDINPVNPGHVLVIAKVHAESIFTLDEPWLTATVLVAQEVARAVQKVFEPYGLNIVQANGPGAAQSVPHFHWHVLPRAQDDGLLMNWPLRPGDMTTIAAAAERICMALQADSGVHREARTTSS